jgi:hypothetical protein
LPPLQSGADFGRGVTFVASRDNRSLMVVTFADLKQSMAKAFIDLQGK